jgi:ATP-dependent DNA ligase
VEKVPSGARWIHEIKFDGYRVQVHLNDAAIKVFTRRGHDWTKRFRKIAADDCEREIDNPDDLKDALGRIAENARKP